MDFYRQWRARRRMRSVEDGACEEFVSKRKACLDASAGFGSDDTCVKEKLLEKRCLATELCLEEAIMFCA